MTSPSDPSIPTLKPKDFQVCLGRCYFSAPFCIGSQSFLVFCNHFRLSLLAKQQNASSGTSVFASFLKLDAPSIVYLQFNAILFYSSIYSQRMTLRQGYIEPVHYRADTGRQATIHAQINTQRQFCIVNQPEVHVFAQFEEHLKETPRVIHELVTLLLQHARKAIKKKKTGDWKILPMALRCPADRKAMHNRRDAIIPRPMLPMVCMFCTLMVCGIRNLRLQPEQGGIHVWVVLAYLRVTNMTDTHAARQLFGHNVALNCTDCKRHTNSRPLPAHSNCVSMHMLEEIPRRAEVHETVLRRERAVADRYNSDGDLLSSPPVSRDGSQESGSYSMS